VLNEFASVASRKLGMSYAEIHDMLGTVRAVCQTQAVIVDTYERGLDIAERFGFSLYDSMIVSSALQFGCTLLYSEDMQRSRVGWATLFCPTLSRGHCWANDKAVCPTYTN